MLNSIQKAVLDTSDLPLIRFHSDYAANFAALPS